MQFMIGAKVAMNVVTIVIIHPARKILPIYTICRFLFFIPHVSFGSWILATLL